MKTEFINQSIESQTVFSNRHHLNIQFSQQNYQISEFVTSQAQQAHLSPPSNQCEIAPVAAIAANESGRVWGDPHFEGADGGKFDVMGQAGKSYNIFNDTDLMLNGKFEQWGNNKNATVISESGLKLGNAANEALLFCKAKPSTEFILNGITLKAGESKKLADGSCLRVSQCNKQINIKTPEGYIITQKAVGNGSKAYLDIKVRSGSQGVNSDNRLPGGLLGETFDVDKNKRAAHDKQGTGALNQHYSNYEVPGGVFGAPKPTVMPNYLQSHRLNSVLSSAQAGLTLPSKLPNMSPVTLKPINWAKEINQTVDQLANPSSSSLNKQEEQVDRLNRLFLIAIMNGNLNLAMLLYARLEIKSAGVVTRKLVSKLSELRDQKQKLIQQIQQLPSKESGNQLAALQQQISTVNDETSSIQSFIKETAQHKNAAVEFANGYMTAEHRTNMSIARSFS